MKRLIFWLVALAIIALLVAMLLPAETGSTLNKNVRCRVVLIMRLRSEIKNYQYEFGRYPAGDYDQVLKKLFRDDSKKIELFRVDPWGTPFAINFLSTNSFVISSAGKNKIFGDADDIIFNSVSNDFVKP
ncbi:MAG TPA: type II secretion system protein [Verrucomicrobiae bacterium]